MELEFAKFHDVARRRIRVSYLIGKAGEISPAFIFLLFLSIMLKTLKGV